MYVLQANRFILINAASCSVHFKRKPVTCSLKFIGGRQNKPTWNIIQTFLAPIIMEKW